MASTPLTGCALLAVALAALAPTALAQEAPWRIVPETDGVVRVPSGSTETVWLRIVSQTDAPVDLFFTVDEIVHLDKDGAAPSGITVRIEREHQYVHLPAGGEARVAVEVLPKDEPGHWRLRTVARDESTSPPTAVVGWFEVSSGPSTTLAAARVAGAGLAGAAAGGVLALLYARPDLRGLLAAPLVALYARVRPSEALSHATRERIHSLVRERPGVGYAELMRETGLGAGVLVHHLRVLERARLVVSRRHGLSRRLYPAGHPEEDEPQGTRAQERVLRELREASLTQRELGDRLRLSQQGVSYHLRNLERAGRVRSEPAGAERRWRALDDGDRAGPS